MPVTLFIYLHLTLSQCTRLDMALLSGMIARLGSWVINISYYSSYV